MNLLNTDTQREGADSEKRCDDAGVSHVPKVSVIVPVYKVEKYLPECIESILAQTFTDFELILVDDGSPDNSGKICDDYAARDSRIRVFHKENGGVSSARNLGLDNARGEWIAFVDSDDMVGKKYLEHLWGGSADSPGPEEGSLVVSGLTYFDGKGHAIRQLHFPVGNRSVCEAFRTEELYRYGYPFAKLFCARELLKANIRFDLEISMAEDMLFMGDYLCVAKSIVFRDFPEDYHYRFVANSLSKRYSSFENEFKLFLRERMMFDNLGICDFEKNEQNALKWAFFRAVSCLYRPPFFGKFNRLSGLEKAFWELRGSEFSEGICSLRERIFLKKYLRAYDFVTNILFRLRYGVFEFLWELYISAINRRRNK